jgi:hypothetical protein
MIEGVNSTMIYCKNFCKCLNVSPKQQYDNKTQHSNKIKTDLSIYLFINLFILWDWGLSSVFHACKAEALSLDLPLQSILDMGSWNYLPGLDSNHNPPDLSLPNS